MITASKLLNIARAEVGTVEANGANNVKYNSAYYGGTVRGEKFLWCVVFVWWCFREANALDLFCYGDKTASTSYVKNAYERKKDFYKDPTEFRPGDLAIFDWSGKQKGSAHIGIIDELDIESGYVYTIEGNTDGVKGDGVYRKKRHLSLITGVCRPAYIQEEIVPEELPEELPETEETETTPEEIVPPVSDETEADATEETVPEEETSEEGEKTPSDEDNAIDEETAEETENEAESEEIAPPVVEEKPLPVITPLKSDDTADLDLVAITATGKIYTRRTETIKLRRTYVTIRMVNGLGENAVGKFNINGYEFVFDGSASIPEKYLKTGQNDVAFTSIDGKIYVASCFIKIGDRITPIGISQSEMVDIAQAYETVLSEVLKCEARLAMLEKSAAGVDLADIILSDERLGELSEALESIVKTETETTTETTNTNENTTADTDAAETEI
jgi:hypothetical protein